MKYKTNGQRPAPQWWCPECGEPARYGRPIRWNPTWGPRPPHSHLDGTPLCPVMTEDGYRPCMATTNAPRAEQRVMPEPSMPARWYARAMAKAATDLHTALQYGQPVELARLSLALSETLHTIGKVDHHLEVAALNTDASVGLAVIRAGALADYAGLAHAEAHLAVLLAVHADRRRESEA